MGALSGRILPFGFAAVLALFAPALAAQTSKSPAADPFAEINRRLLRAADLESQASAGYGRSRDGHAGESALSSAARTDKQIPRLVGDDTHLPGEVLSAAHPGVFTLRPDRHLSARQKLLNLGVDAAQIFQEEGVPRELLRVAAVESHFQPTALSPKGARGLWQLMPATARRFGLRVEPRADQRMDPPRATRAAARYLRGLYSQFGDWRLALAAYNAGEGRVAAAISRAGTRDFGRLAELALLPTETVRYVSAVLGSISGERTNP